MENKIKLVDVTKEEVDAFTKKLAAFLDEEEIVMRAILSPIVDTERNMQGVGAEIRIWKKAQDDTPEVEEAPVEEEVKEDK